MAIPKVFIKEGVQATQAAKEAVAKISKATKKEVITTEKLLRSPASDVFEKKGVMEAEAFWHAPQNFANYARGQYLTEGGKDVQRLRLTNKVISKNGNLEKGFAVTTRLGKDEVIYYEKDLLTGEIRNVFLRDGKPYMSCSNTSLAELYHNPSTGAPSLRRENLINNDGKFLGEKVTEFADDGRTIVSERIK